MQKKFNNCCKNSEELFIAKIIVNAFNKKKSVTFAKKNSLGNAEKMLVKRNQNTTLIEMKTYTETEIKEEIDQRHASYITFFLRQ